MFLLGTSVDSDIIGDSNATRDLVNNIVDGLLEDVLAH